MNDNYPSYQTPSTGAKNILQIFSLISVVSHDYKFILISNTFTLNSATKAIVYLDLNDRKKYGYEAIFASNTFNRNGAFIDGGAIYLRARSKLGVKVVAGGTITDANYPCGWILILKQYFLKHDRMSLVCWLSSKILMCRL